MVVVRQTKQTNKLNDVFCLSRKLKLKVQQAGSRSKKKERKWSKVSWFHSEILPLCYLHKSDMWTVLYNLCLLLDRFHISTFPVIFLLTLTFLLFLWMFMRWIQRPWLHIFLLLASGYWLDNQLPENTSYLSTYSVKNGAHPVHPLKWLQTFSIQCSFVFILRRMKSLN